MLCVVLDQVIERMEQLRSDTIGTRAVSYDAEMFVAMWRLHRQRVIADLAHGSNTFNKYRH